LSGECVSYKKWDRKCPVRIFVLHKNGRGKRPGTTSGLGVGNVLDSVWGAAQPWSIAPSKFGELCYPYSGPRCRMAVVGAYSWPRKREGAVALSVKTTSQIARKRANSRFATQPRRRALVSIIQCHNFACLLLSSPMLVIVAVSHLWY
jgi:hypothetical protein